MITPISPYKNKNLLLAAIGFFMDITKFELWPSPTKLKKVVAQRYKY